MGDRRDRERERGSASERDYQQQSLCNGMPAARSLCRDGSRFTLMTFIPALNFIELNPPPSARWMHGQSARGAEAAKTCPPRIVMQIYLTLALLALLAGSGMGKDSKNAHGIHVSSPVQGQRLARGQDLVLKYAVGDAGVEALPCRVVLVVNGRVLATRDGCRASVAVSEDDLVLGSNSVELFRQGDDAQEEEASVTFEVVEPAPWPSPPGQGAGGDAGGDKACHREDAACRRRVCIHRVGDSCLIYDDAWARAHGAVPRILHWVWVGGGGDIPDKFHPMMESWRRLHPDWQTVIWTDDKITWELRNR